ncbi:LuxR family transcriptional regulator [Mycobacterium sp. 236(2023)]|uniref:helix-turn-helix transcriptional regulator n=1 Tax=Mycobacterium sp. 236(2023) TaxID=3038163 RepID=UPI002415516C|nr:LuxR family transcriptional regulator [Mycobacterium sp. 236(2023)]MDG4665691.1 AAA family ATPase [Mycobacterium sp. 236(2023)]
MSTDVLARAVGNETVDRFLAMAQIGPAALVIEGEAGIGKTTMWSDICDAARDRGFRIATSRPAQAESVLAYAAVADLLADVDGEAIDVLPELQRLAVNRVLLRAGSDGPATDQRVVAAAMGALLETLATDTAVLIAIDDVQWLDPSSRAVLTFVARRLTGRVGILVTERCEALQGTTTSWLKLARPEEIARLRLGPLSIGALHVLLMRKLGRSFSRAVMVRIAEVAGGNPFYSLELARAMDGQRPATQTGLPSTLADLVRVRLGRLDGDVREILLAVASVAAPTVDLLARLKNTTAEHVVGLLEDVETDGIIGIDGNRVRFSHPLLARGIYSDATPADRRAMHRALAVIEGQPELKARHLAMAATSADDATLASLDEAAETARSRGAPAAAAELVELAIGLGGDKPWRRLRAAGDHFQAGDTGRARVLLEEVAGNLRPGMLRAIAFNLLGALYIYDNQFLEATDLLTKAVDEAADVPAVAVQALMSLSFAQGMGSFAEGTSEEGLFEIMLDNSRRAVELAESVGMPSVTSQALAMWVHTLFIHGHGVDDAALDRALELEAGDDDVAIPFRASAVNALILAWTGRLDEAAARMLAVRASCEERGSDRNMMAVASYSAMIEMWRGNLTAAESFADEGVERAQQLGGRYVEIIPLSVRSVVAAYQGREEDARSDAHAALEAATECGATRMADWPRMTLGLIEVSLGNHAEAIDAVAPLLSRLHIVPGTELMHSWYLPDAAEAYVALGNLDAADDIVDVMERNGRTLDRPWMLAVALRCRAMSLAARGDVEAAEEVARRAMAEHDRVPMPFERARTQLLLGQLQRRRRVKDAAAATLREALEVFESMGAAIWARRAHAELARTNVGRTSDRELTPSEQRTAELAAAGMTNRDIASTLFISQKTVEHNLGRVYRKLGIKTRAELGRKMDGIRE